MTGLVAAENLRATHDCPPQFDARAFTRPLTRLSTQLRRALTALALGMVGAGALVVSTPTGVGAQDLRCEKGDREVRSLHFTGNRAFGNGELARVVVTTPSALLSGIGLGARRCLSPDEFPRDVLRLVAYYRKRGYRSASVDTVVRSAGGSAARPRVAVTFAIHEGAPLRLDTLTVVGLDGVRGAARARASIRLRPGDVFDRVALEAGRDTLRERLRNGGYPQADALLASNTDPVQLRASATVTVVPGPFTRVGRVTVRGTGPDGGPPRIPDRVVLGTLGIRPGDPVRLGDLLDAQRTLYQTDAYRRVDVRLDTIRPTSTTSAIAPGGLAAPTTAVADLLVTADEGALRAAEASAGWATLDCFRLRADLTDRYFVPQAQRLELSGRLSHIGIGHPLAFAPGLCGPARSDAYADTVNYYLSATVRQPSFFRLRRVPSVTLFTSRSSEYNAFERLTPLGALFSLASRPGSRLPSTFTYQVERGRTTANAAVFCAVFSACDDLTRSALDRNRTVGTLGYAIARNRANDPLNPSSGNVERLTLRHSSALTGSEATQRFNKAVLDASYYRPVAGGVLTLHAQGGTVLGDAPQQERLFAGGPTTVRGYRQNELGPQVYLLTNVVADTSVGGVPSFRAAPGAKPERTIPAGGNTLLVGNLELQLRSPVLPELLALALFTDAGEVFNRGTNGTTVAAGGRSLRVTPGAGVRVRSPFGAIRVDLGYNPYIATAGPAFYVAPGDTKTQALYCVSPGNTTVGPIGSGSGGGCTPTYRPPSNGSFLRRLNPSIWIGQAF